MSSVGVTGARASVSNKVQTLLEEIKEVCPLNNYLDIVVKASKFVLSELSCAL